MIQIIIFFFALLFSVVFFTDMVFTIVNIILNGTVNSNDSIKRAFFILITVILWTIFYSM